MRLLGVPLAATVILLGQPALAVATADKPTVTISPTAQAPDLGKLISGASATTFHVAAGSGAVSRTSGDGIRLASSSVTSPLVTISCQTTVCRNSTITVTLTPGLSSSGRLFRAMAFNISDLTGATLVSGSTSGAAPLVFTLSPLGASGTASFRLGLDSRMPSTGAYGTATWSYTAQATGN